MLAISNKLNCYTKFLTKDLECRKLQYHIPCLFLTHAIVESEKFHQLIVIHAISCL